MTRRYAHFLGYAAAEGGIVELISDDTFSIGNIDLKTGEREFDNVTFTTPMSSIFNVKPLSNYSAILLTDMEYDTTQVELDSLTTLYAGQKLWIENERIKLVSLVSGIKWNITRGENSSIPIKHLSVNVPGGIASRLTTVAKRLSPLGLIVRIYEGTRTLFYGQVSNVSIGNSGFVSVECVNLYNQMQNPIAMRVEQDCNLSALKQRRQNEFFSLLSYNPGAIYPGKTDDKGTYKLLSKPADYFQQILNLENAFLYFDGTYKVGYLNRVPISEDVEKCLLGDYVTASGGGIEVTMAKSYSSASVKGEGFEFGFTLNDSNLNNVWLGAEEIEVDVSALGFSLTEYSEEELQNLIMYKLFMLNSIIEHLDISIQRHAQVFQVGSYYKFLDIYKYFSFSDDIRNTVYLCISIDEDKASFIRTTLFTAKQIAPSFVFQKTDTKTYTIQNVFTLSEYVNDNFDSLNSLVHLKNKYTGDIVFEIGDKFVLIETDGSVSEVEIDAVNTSSIVTDTDIGSLNDFFIGTIQLWSGGSIDDKNQIYLYDTNTEVL
jgi:hypothetical protein